MCFIFIRYLFHTSKGTVVREEVIRHNPRMLDLNFIRDTLRPIEDSSPVIWGMSNYVLVQVLAVILALALTQSIAQHLSFKVLHNKRPWLEEMLQLLRRPVLFMLTGGAFLLVLENYFGPAIILSVMLKLALGMFFMRMVQTAHLSASLEKSMIAIVWGLILLNLTDRFAPFLEAMNRVQITLGDKVISASSVLKAVLVFAFFWWIISNAAKLLESELRRRRVKPAARTLLMKIIYIMGFFIAFFVSLDTLGVDLGAFALFGGALGVGLGFGLRAMFSNFLGGFELLMDKTIKPGDVVSVSNTEGSGIEIFGQVIAMNNRCVIIRQRDGRERMIPNEKILTQEIMNWSFSNKLVRQEVYIRVGHKSDMEKVREILIDCIKTVPRAATMPAPNAFIKEFQENGTVFYLRFWHNDPEDGVNNVKGDVQMAAWKALRDNDIEIPPPQLRLVDLPVDISS